MDTLNVTDVTPEDDIVCSVGARIEADANPMMSLIIKVLNCRNE